MFYGKPSPATIPALGINTQASNGSSGDLNSYKKVNFNGHVESGTVALTFDQVVTDPVLDLSGLGGYVNALGEFQLQNGAWDIVGRGSFNDTDI